MDFMSVWRMHRIAVLAAPHMEIGITIGATLVKNGGVYSSYAN